MYGCMVTREQRERWTHGVRVNDALIYKSGTPAHATRDRRGRQRSRRCETRKMRSLPRYSPVPSRCGVKVARSPRRCRFGVLLIWRVPKAKFGQAREASPQRASLHRTPRRLITYAAPVVPHTAWCREWPRRGAVFGLSHSGCRHRQGVCSVGGSNIVPFSLAGRTGVGLLVRGLRSYGGARTGTQRRSRSGIPYGSHVISESFGISLDLAPACGEHAPSFSCFALRREHDGH